ncbi:hypothetical protein OIV83_003972 [Microbotryomycetes sp. JL201]|nr:hypothetical protein OIV83_003972 [Microbotryomycetes sp. JL201]
MIIDKGDIVLAPGPGPHLVNVPWPSLVVNVEGNRVIIGSIPSAQEYEVRLDDIRPLPNNPCLLDFAGTHQDKVDYHRGLEIINDVDLLRLWNAKFYELDLEL